MKTRHLLCAAVLGLGLTIILLSTLPRLNPIVQAGGIVHYYYVREGATGDCLTVTTPCSSVVRAISLATAPGDNEVWVATGTYTENLVITHSLSLRGGWNAPFTVQNPTSYTTTVRGITTTHVLSANTDVGYLLIEGFTLQGGRDGIHLYGTPTALRTAGGGSITVVSNTVRGAIRQGIEVDGSHYVLLINNLIADIEREGIEIDDGTVFVRGNTIDGVGRYGILVEGGSVTIQDNIIHNVQDAGYHGVRLESDGAITGNHIYQIADRGIDARRGASTIENNRIHDTGGDGIRTDDSSTDVEIRGNTVYSTGSDGIDARGVIVVVASNTIHDAGKDGVHAEGASTIRVQHNTINDVDDDGIESDCVSNSFINTNRVYRAAGAGIQLDDAGTFAVTNNVVAGSGAASILIKTGAFAYSSLHHNTLVGGAAVQQATGISVTVTGVTIPLANNIVVSHTVGITQTAGATLVVSNTLLWHNGNDPISGTAAITQAPCFVAPASCDYHILPDSPAFNAGIDIGVLTDVDGDPRVGAPDVGADEIVWQVYLPLVMRDY